MKHERVNSLLKQRLPREAPVAPSSAALRTTPAEQPGALDGGRGPSTQVQADASNVQAPMPVALNVLVIGNGMVSHEFCRQMTSAAARPGSQAIQITVIGEEPRPAYDRVNLTEYLRGRDEPSLLLSPRQWYDDVGIKLITGEQALSIDRRHRLVRTDAGRELHYDKLILATGSSPFVPRIEGVDLPGVFVYRTLEDLDAIRAKGGSSYSAAVIGGGLLGLEAARAMMDLGLSVQVLELASNLMPAQLEPGNAAVLEQRARALGMKLHLSVQTTRITAVAKGLVLHTHSGREICTDMVVISAGIRPRDELAKACGIEVGLAGGGILVDDQLRTNDPNIHAIGECARHRGMIYGLAAPGYQMARVLASNLHGGDERFEEADLSTRLKMLGLDVAVLGEYRGGRQSAAWTVEGKRRQLLLEEGVLVGAVIVGACGEIPQIQQGIDQRRRISFRRLKKFRATGELWPEEAATSVAQWPDEALVCSCLRVSAGKLRGHIAQGAVTVEALAQCTGASTVCGSCKPLLAQMLGSPALHQPMRGIKTLQYGSLLALTAVLCMLMLRPLPMADSVLSFWHQVDVLWRDSFWKQFTGYTLLGLCALAVTLPLRKRVKRLAGLGSIGAWRAVHALIGTAALVALVAHTGMRLGHNLNFALMICFLLLNLLGAAAGIVTAMESRATGQRAFLARQWRPWLTLAHIVLFWPLPVLIVFHVLSVYLY